MKKHFSIAIACILLSQLIFSQNDCACCTENHKAFDFWVGEWQVTNPDGSVAGTNVIKKLENGCVLNESWTSAKSKSTGASMNFYNQTSGKWEQLWLDNSGGHLKLKGNRLNNQMILSSDEFIGSDGNKTVNRITWTLNKDGTVQQLWEVLQDNEVVNVAFDGRYRKIE